MGRIKTQLIKRTARKLFARYTAEVKTSFDENKPVVSTHLQNPNKKMRNIIAGYLARLAKQKIAGNKPKPKMAPLASRTPRYGKPTSRPR